MALLNLRVSPGLRLVRRVKNFIKMMLTMTSGTRTQHKCAVWKSRTCNSAFTLSAALSAAGGEQAQAASSWAFGEDPMDKLSRNTEGRGLGPVYMVVSTNGQRVFPKLWFLRRFKLKF